MSGLVGIFHLDGRPVGSEALLKMNSMLSHRGGDGAGIWNEAAVGLGHRLMWTTCESLQEHLPMTDGKGALVLTSDARIDNRQELYDALAARGRPIEEISDSALILSAYQKWGDRCAEKLLGDFAFVLWDRHRRILFCARDHFGVKPLYYFHRPGRLFACASEIKALFTLPEISPSLSEMQIAEYLEGICESKSSTFYQGVFRLPPAHCMTVGTDGLRLREYWSLDSTRVSSPSSDNEYADEYREIFTEAVRCRLRSQLPVGSHLSGGLDSSSVTCVARQILGPTNAPLHIFSNVFDDLPQCDERPFIDAVLKQGGYLPHYVFPEQSHPLVDIDRVFWHQGEPAIGPNHFLPWELNRAAQNAGVRVVLDGFDGDTTVSHGAIRFTELAVAGEWETFAREANAVSKHFPVSPVDLLQNYGIGCLKPLGSKHRWLSFATAINEMNKYFQVSRRELLWQHGLMPFLPTRLFNRQAPVANVNNLIVNSKLAHKVGLTEHLRAQQQSRGNPPLTVREDQWRTLTSGLFTSVLEMSDRCAAAFSLEVRHPFMDKRLIEFCLALPPEQKLNQGWGRIVLRRAMSSILPDEVRWRGGKADMTPNFLTGLLKVDRKVVEDEVFNPSEALAAFVDINALQQTYRRLSDGNKAKMADAMQVWRVVTLGKWLKSLAKREAKLAQRDDCIVAST